MTTTHNTTQNSWVARSPGKVMIAGEYSLMLGLTKGLACTVSRQLQVTATRYPRSSQGYCIIHSSLWKHPKSLSFDHIRHKPSKELCCFTLHRLLDHLEGILPNKPNPNKDHYILDIRIDSALPLEAGIGSSAALILALLHAVAACLNTPLSDCEVIRLGYDIQKSFQDGHSSGYDILTIARGGVTLMEKSATSPLLQTIPSHSIDVDYLNKTFHLFHQNHLTSPTASLTAKTLPYFITPKNALTQRGKVWVTQQKAFLAALLKRAPPATIIPLLNDIRSTLKQTPAFPKALKSLEAELISPTISFKTTGAGGMDTLLVCGTCDDTASTILKDHGYLKAAYVFSHKLSFLPKTAKPTETTDH